MLRILVVDDDMAVRGAIKMVLEHDGHDVTLAANGRAGVAAVEAGAFDLVICYISFMPGMDGIETIHAFHQHHPRMPVIAMSGFMFRDGQTPAPDYLSLSTKLGAAYSLRKPFCLQELLKAVRQCKANLKSDRDLKAGGLTLVSSDAFGRRMRSDRTSNRRGLAHIREKPGPDPIRAWIPVSRLREALASPLVWTNASAGEGRSETDMRQRKNSERIPFRMRSSARGRYEFGFDRRRHRIARHGRDLS